MQRDLELLLLPPEQNPTQQIRVFDGKADSIENFLDLINRVHKEHLGTLWILAATIISPQGHIVMFSGALNSGKSTAALALVYGYGWKVISEDITHIDMHKNEIINFASPFAIKPGTLALLKNSFSSMQLPPESGPWMKLGEANLGHSVPTPIDLVVHFDSSSDDPFVCKQMSVADYTKTLLQKSNIARLKGAADKIYEYVVEGNCYLMKNGSLTERVETILQLCDARENKSIEVISK